MWGHRHKQRCLGDRQIFKSLTKSHQLSVTPSQSSQIADFWESAHIQTRRTSTRTRTLYFSHQWRRENFSPGVLFNRGHEKVLSPAEENKQTSTNIKWLFTGLDTSAEFSSMVADKISITERKRGKKGGKIVITNCRGTQLSQQLQFVFLLTNNNNKLTIYQWTGLTQWHWNMFNSIPLFSHTHLQKSLWIWGVSTDTVNNICPCHRMRF